MAKKMVKASGIPSSYATYLLKMQSFWNRSNVIITEEQITNMPKFKKKCKSVIITDSLIIKIPSCSYLHPPFWLHVLNMEHTKYGREAAAESL